MKVKLLRDIGDYPVGSILPARKLQPSNEIVIPMSLDPSKPQNHWTNFLAIIVPSEEALEIVEP